MIIQNHLYQGGFLFPPVMNYKKLPFKIGEQYELNEFNLEPINEVIIGKYCYDVYKYFGDIKSIFGFKVQSIELFYNADILLKVKICLYGNVMSELLNILSLSEKETIFDAYIKTDIFYSSISDVTNFEYFDDYV